jgi:Mn-dependent DtxR family transcriptional regulator
MLDTIKKYHQQHGHYPNHSQLAAMLGVTRRKVASDLRKLEKAGVIEPVEVRQFYPGAYRLR